MPRKINAISVSFLRILIYFLRNNIRDKIHRRCKLRVGNNERWWADFAHIAAIIAHANDYPASGDKSRWVRNCAAYFQTWSSGFKVLKTIGNAFQSTARKIERGSRERERDGFRIRIYKDSTPDTRSRWIQRNDARWRNSSAKYASIAFTADQQSFCLSPSRKYARKRLLCSIHLTITNTHRDCMIPLF